jgi:homoserine O-acetyltransferase
VAQPRERADADGVVVPATGDAIEVREGILEIPGALAMHHGGSLAGVRIAWRLAGASGGPVVAALGGISAHRCVFTSGSHRGWWDALVGPGRGLDSGRFRILGFDFLGGSGESSGPDPDRPFPSISTYDQAEVLARLLDHLGIARLHAIAGASYGGMVALAFGEKFAQRVDRLLVIGAADRTHPMATAWRSVQRRLLQFALRHDAGPEGVMLARALAMATYRSPAEFAARFSAPPRRVDAGFVFPVEDYLFARGADYATRYRPEAFLCLSESIDLHAVDAGSIRVPTTLVAVQQDQLVPVSDVRALCARLEGRGRLVEISSNFGHDAFLKEAGRLRPVFRSALE